MKISRSAMHAIVGYLVSSMMVNHGCLMHRLLKVQPLPMDSIDDDDIEETFHDAVEEIVDTVGRDSSKPSEASEAIMAISAHGDIDAGEEGDPYLDPEALKARRKERKKEKKAMKKAAKAEGSQGEEEDLSPLIGEDGAEVVQGALDMAAGSKVGVDNEAADKTKKKKKKKKKSGASSAVTSKEAAEVEGGDEADEDPSIDEAVTSGPVVPEPPRSPPPREVKGATPSMPSTPSAASLDPKRNSLLLDGAGGSKAVLVDLAADFAAVSGAPGSVGVSSLGSEWLAPSGSASAFNLFGPLIKVCLIDDRNTTGRQ